MLVGPGTQNRGVHNEDTFLFLLGLLATPPAPLSFSCSMLDCLSLRCRGPIPAPFGFPSTALLAAPNGGPGAQSPLPPTVARACWFRQSAFDRITLHTRHNPSGLHIRAWVYFAFSPLLLLLMAHLQAVLPPRARTCHRPPSFPLSTAFSRHGDHCLNTALGSRAPSTRT